MKRGIEGKNESGSDISISESLRKNLDALKIFIENVADKYSMPYDDVIGILGQKEKNSEILIPSFIFRDGNLGILESVSKYLKEQKTDLGEQVIKSILY